MLNTHLKRSKFDNSPQLNSAISPFKCSSLENQSIESPPFFEPLAKKGPKAHSIEVLSLSVDNDYNSDESSTSE